MFNLNHLPVDYSCEIPSLPSRQQIVIYGALRVIFDDYRFVYN